MYLAKLQPKLVERYFQNSRVWHQFLTVTKEDLITIDIDSNIGHFSFKPTLSAPGYCLDNTEVLSPEVINKVEVSSADNAIRQTLPVKGGKN